MFWIFSEYLGSFLNRYYIIESELRNKVIHCFHFFPYRIKQCDMNIRHDNLQRNTRKSPTRTNIEDFFFYFLRFSYDRCTKE